MTKISMLLLLVLGILITLYGYAVAEPVNLSNVTLDIHEKDAFQSIPFIPRNSCSNGESCCRFECVECVNTGTNVTNCGTCGKSCTGAKPGCCSGTCADLNSNPNHCGSCATACTGVKPGCCSGKCVDWSSNLNNCGACGRLCTPVAGGGGCINGTCVASTSSTFGVLGASTVTNTGNSVIHGDLGVSPGTSITGFPPGNYTGTLHINDTTAAQAQLDAASAYHTAVAFTATRDLTGLDLGGLTLTAGVYKFSSSAGLKGVLTLDGQGLSTARFIFQIGSTLTTANASSVVLVNNANAKNVIWQVGSSATLGTTTNFKGIILALASITANSGVTVSGSLIALNAAVTLINVLVS